MKCSIEFVFTNKFCCTAPSRMYLHGFMESFQMEIVLDLTQFSMNLFSASHEWRVGSGAEKPLFSKICHISFRIMKLSKVITYLKKIQKNIIHVNYSLSYADITMFSPEISNFCFIKKYRYRLHFNT